MRTKSYNLVVERRKKRVRAHIARGTSETPRISVFRSNTHMHVQFISDAEHKTLVAASTLSLKPAVKRAGVEACKRLGQLAAKLAKEKGIAKGVFDRGLHRFHGRIRAFLTGLREGGIAV